MMILRYFFPAMSSFLFCGFELVRDDKSRRGEVLLV